MNQNNLDLKAGSELLSLRACFVCGKQIFVRNVRGQNYCSPECYDTKDYAQKFVNNEKGFIPKEIQATINQRYSRQGAQRQSDRQAIQDQIERQKRIDSESRGLSWNEAVREMWR
jgi:hypothetical protein